MIKLDGEQLADIERRAQAVADKIYRACVQRNLSAPERDYLWSTAFRCQGILELADALKNNQVDEMLSTLEEDAEEIL